MKNSVIAVLLLIVFCSCTITKRKYTKGWHVESMFHKASTPAIKSQALNLKSKDITCETQAMRQTANELVAPHRILDKAITSSNKFLGKKKNLTIKAVPIKVTTFKPQTFMKEFKFSFQGKEGEKSHNFSQIIAVYSLFTIGLILICLVAVSLNNAWGIAAAMALVGILSLAISVALSLGFLDEINTLNLPEKKWPYKLIISFSLIILSLVVSIIFALAFALFFLEPNLSLVLAVTALFFLLSIIICFNFLLPD